MEVFIDKTRIKNLVWEGKVEIVPIAFARGRSFNNSFIIVDEAQNCTDKQLLLILTRLGKGSKMCVNGDLKQSDLRTESGLIDAIKRLQGIKGVSFIRLDETDIVRHPLVAEIVKRYEEPLAASA
jgi:phosphate starvation-inducible PhoH-like protein